MSSEGSHHDLIELLFEIGLFDGFASRGRRRVGGGEEGARVRSGPFSEKCIAVSSEELGRFGGVSGCLCDGVVVDELATGLVGAASDGGRGEEREREKAGTITLSRAAVKPCSPPKASWTSLKNLVWMSRMVST